MFLFLLLVLFLFLLWFEVLNIIIGGEEIFIATNFEPNDPLLLEVKEYYKGFVLNVQFRDLTWKPLVDSILLSRTIYFVGTWDDMVQL